MSAKRKSFRTPLGLVRGLGSAKEGSHHWWKERVTAIVMIPLLLFIVAGFFNNVVFGGYTEALQWLSMPLVAVVMLLTIFIAAYHAAGGVQVVIEDYVHCEGIKIASIIAVKLALTLVALLGAVFVTKILFFQVVQSMIDNAKH